MAETLFTALLRQTLLLALVSALLLLLRHLLRRRFGAGLAYASWLLLPLVLIAGSLAAQAPVRTMYAQFARQVGVASTAPLALPELPSNTTIWLALWTCGSACVLLHMVRQQWRLQRSLKREGAHWIGSEGPALIGLWPARLLLPRDFSERFDATQQQLVLAHEQMHRARFDNHWNALAAALLVLHWFNPLAWLAARAMRADQELACDEAVMARHPGREADYARALLAAQGGPTSVALPWSRWTSSHPLIERIAMLDQFAAVSSLARRRAGRVVLASLALLGVFGAQGLRAAGEDAGPKVRLVMRIEIEQQTDADHIVKDISTMTEIIASGGTGKVIVGSGPTKPDPDHPAPNQVMAEFTPRALGDGLFDIRFDISGGLPKPLSSKPRLIVKDGEKARIEIGRSAQQPGLKIEVTPSLVKA